jgi:hypothetical protein
LAVVTAVSAGVVFAMPVASQAMSASTPVKISTADNNIVNIAYNKKKWKSWARYCRYNYDDWRCNQRRPYARYHRYRSYDEPYYGSYRPYRPYRPGIYLNVD